jgi:putative phosphoribosyl transferase
MCASSASVPAVSERTQPYTDRDEGGRVLAGELARQRPELAGHLDAVVLGLARGGVPVAAAVAAALTIPFDALLVRKLGLPAQPELAMGALAESGDHALVVRNDAVLHQFAVPPAVFERVHQRELLELRTAAAAYRGGRPPAALGGKVVVIVDDGLATGSSMRAAVAAVRAQAPGKILIAIPVASGATCTALRAEVDDLVCAWTPTPFYAVGQAYRDFTPTSDAEVRRALHGAGSA